MSELVDRLRKAFDSGVPLRLSKDGGSSERDPLCNEAANRIVVVEAACGFLEKENERLRAEVARLDADAKRFDAWAQNPYTNFQAAWRLWDCKSDWRTAFDAALSGERKMADLVDRLGTVGLWGEAREEILRLREKLRSLRSVVFEDYRHHIDAAIGWEGKDDVA